MPAAALGIVLLCFGPTACRGVAEREAAAPSLHTVELIAGVPEGAAQPEGPLPVVVAVHGLGDQPENICRFVAEGLSAPAKVVCPRAPESWGEGFSWFPSVRALEDEAELATAVASASDLVAGLLESLARDAANDGKPILFGYSQGGMIAYHIALDRSDRVRAVAAVAGLLPASLLEAPTGPMVSLAGFHGMADTLVPYRGALRTFDVFDRAWDGSRFFRYEGLGHGMSAKMRDDIYATLNEWLVKAGE